MAELDDFEKMFEGKETGFDFGDEPANPPQESPADTATVAPPQAAQAAQVAPPPVQAQPQVPAAQHTSAPPAAPSDIVFTFSDKAANSLDSMGIIVAEIGTKVSRVPIERYKASTQKTDRIGFISPQVTGLKYHYIENGGAIVCFGGKCCDMEGIPRVRYLFPIVVYQTDAEGNLMGSKVELKVLIVGEDIYKTIITMAKSSASQGGIDHVDMLVTCTDDQYQKITLTPCGPAAWRRSQKVVNYLAERWNEDGANAYMALARKVNEAEYLKLKGMDEGDQKFAESAVTKEQDLSKFFDS